MFSVLLAPGAKVLSSSVEIVSLSITTVSCSVKRMSFGVSWCSFSHIAKQPYSHTVLLLLSHRATWPHRYTAAKDPTTGGWPEAAPPLWRRPEAASLCGYVALWLCGSVAMQLCSYVAPWLCGYVAIWIAGALRTRVFQGQQQCHPFYSPVSKHILELSRVYIL